MERFSEESTKLDTQKRADRKSHDSQLQQVLPLTYAKQSLQELSSEELVKSVASLRKREEITWVHFEGRIPDVLATAIPQIRALLPHATFSIEFEKPHREGLLDLLPLPDIAFFSHLYLKHFKLTSPYDFFRKMRQNNPKALFIMTAGAEGAYYSTLKSEGHVPTEKVDVVDATGAGDTFIAGYIYASQRLGKDVKESVEFAVSLATNKVTREGFEGLIE